ncbi:MAG: protein-export chaperone SecB [Arenicella sp.]
MAENEQASVQFDIRKIYLKDASLESPQAPEIFLQLESSPEIEIDVNIKQTELQEAGYYEIVLNISTHAKFKDKTAFLCEVQQAGVFVIMGLPEAELPLALNIACPNVLLPFAREAISDLVTKAGFPQLLLSPINFEALYHQKQQSSQKH